MRVLVVKLSALGDVVQSLPVAMAIKRQKPEARIDWLVERPSSGLLMGHPALNRVLVSPRHLIADEKSKLIPEVSRFNRELRQVRYDAVLDLQGLMKSAIFVALSRGGRKIGFSGGKEPLAAWALNQRLAPFDPDRPALERYLDILTPLGFTRPARVEFGLEPEPGALEAARGLLAEPGLGDSVVVLHPMAKWESKLWPMENWAELAKGLVEKGLMVVLTGSKADAPVTAEIARRSGVGGDIIDLAGKTGLKDLAALLTLASVVICTDTGVMHLAAAMGAPVTALFGPTAPWRTGPHGKGHRVLRLGLDCSPCFLRKCPDPRCLTELGPEMVLDAVMEQMDENNGSRPGPAHGS